MHNLEIPLSSSIHGIQVKWKRTGESEDDGSDEAILPAEYQGFERKDTLILDNVRWQCAYTLAISPDVLMPISLSCSPDLRRLLMDDSRVGARLTVGVLRLLSSWPLSTHATRALY